MFVFGFWFWWGGVPPTHIPVREKRLTQSAYCFQCLEGKRSNELAMLVKKDDARDMDLSPMASDDVSRFLCPRRKDQPGPHGYKQK